MKEINQRKLKIKKTNRTLLPVDHTTYLPYGYTVLNLISFVDVTAIIALNQMKIIGIINARCKKGINLIHQWSMRNPTEALMTSIDLVRDFLKQDVIQ